MVHTNIHCTRSGWVDVKWTHLVTRTTSVSRARTVTVPFTVYRRYLAYRLAPCTAGIHHSGMPVQTKFSSDVQFTCYWYVRIKTTRHWRLMRRRRLGKQSCTTDDRGKGWIASTSPSLPVHCATWRVGSETIHDGRVDWQVAGSQRRRLTSHLLINLTVVWLTAANPSARATHPRRAVTPAAPTGVLHAAPLTPSPATHRR